MSLYYAVLLSALLCLFGWVLTVRCNIIHVAQNTTIDPRRLNATSQIYFQISSISGCSCTTICTHRFLARDSIIICYSALHTPCLKNKQNYFCYNFVKFSPTLTIFGTKMAKRLKLYEVHSLSTSPNSCHQTTVLNADVPNCYITL